MNWSKILLLVALLLLVASLAVYVARAVQMIALERDWPSYNDQMQQEAVDRFGLDRPLASQHGAFMLLFISALLVGAAYGMYGRPEPAVHHSPLVKIILILSLVTNAITALRVLLLAPTPLLWVAPWWFIVGLALFGLMGFVFSLAVWKGRKWGMYGLVVSMGLAALFEFLGGMPWLDVLFGFSLVVVLWFFLRPVWWQME
jgi:hypothetical protein